VTIGVLALQGDVREHASAFAQLGESVREVRRPSDLAELTGLVVPGGESTTLSLLLGSAGLIEPLSDALTAGLPVFGTCAGMILLASTVLDGRPDQVNFNAIDLTIRRNGYGSQRASFEGQVVARGLGDEPLPAVFIRAPVVEGAGPAVDVLATLPGVGGDAGHPVICRQGPVLVAAFHPELTADRRLQRLFVEMTKEERH
jgi:pyridoxal 5'-phosphate synthase pdxT subunit